MSSGSHCAACGSSCDCQEKVPDFVNDELICENIRDSKNRDKKSAEFCTVLHFYPALRFAMYSAMKARILRQFSSICRSKFVKDSLLPVVLKITQ